MLKDTLNRPLHDLRISVTDRCNFRCGYCMPKDVFGKGYPFLKSSALLTYEEIEKLVRVFADLGVKKVRLTGGEPLLRKDLEELVARITLIPNIKDIAMTTNASLLTMKRAVSLKKAGIKRINISLDALTPEIYQQINQISYPLEDILKGVENALNCGFESVKVNMVIQKGVNVDDILPMVEYFKNSDAILRFIEFMDVGNHNNWNMTKVFSSREIIDLISTTYPLIPIDANYKGEVAKRWRYQDGKGEIGVISSITQPFCNNCARARLSAKGELYSCLFATNGFDLKQLLYSGASEDEIKQEITSLWTHRNDQYSMLRSQNIRVAPLETQPKKVEMSYIGG